MRILQSKIAGLLVTAWLLSIVFSTVPAQAVSSTTSYIMLYLDKTESFINSDKVTLDSPATIKDGSTYVPVKFLGDAFGVKVEWNDKTRQIEMAVPGSAIIFDSDHKTITVNGVPQTFDSVAYISSSGRLMVKLTWLADFVKARYTYNGDLRRVELLYVKTPDGMLNVGSGNSRPVAKFTTNKLTYRIGEPVKYVSLSYDPDAEGIAKETWVGKQEAFFVPGSYPVTLMVQDRHGNKSMTYTRNITVENIPYLTEVEYPIYMKPVGSFIDANWSMLYDHFLDRPELPKTVTADNSRTLLVSDSPEEFTEPGILYQDKAKGKVRLYADHVNGTKEKMVFGILVTNPTDKPVTIETTNKGEVYPSVYANLIGHEASVDFLMHDPISEKMVVAPKQTLVYMQMPDFYPGYGVNVFYDLQTDGELQFSFVTDKTINVNMLATAKKLPFTGHVRGTFPVSDLKWDIDGSAINETMTLTIGDNKTDKFVEGFDVQRNTPSVNGGNYGVIYNIHIDKPRKMAVLFLPRGGVFAGPFKINGEFVMVPPSGVMTAFDGLQVMARTTGEEESLDIEFTPPAGSAFPVDLIFYPLEDKE